MAYAQWVIIVLHNVGAKDFKLKNLNPSWGKLYADGSCLVPSRLRRC